MKNLFIVLGVLVLSMFKHCPSTPPCITCIGSKDSLLWNYVQKKDDILSPGQPKFTKLSPCVKVIGTVIQSVFFNSKDDGDGSIVLQLDTTDYRLVKELDKKSKKMANVVECEVMWYDTSGSLPFYIHNVSGHYINHITLSEYKKGDRVTVTGMLITDNAGDGQYEIHPVFSVEPKDKRK